MLQRKGLVILAACAAVAGVSPVRADSTAASSTAASSTAATTTAAKSSSASSSTAATTAATTSSTPTSSGALAFTGPHSLSATTSVGAAAIALGVGALAAGAALKKHIDGEAAPLSE